MVLHSITPLHEKAQQIRHTLSCLQEGVRRARRQAKAEKLEANLAARWQG